MQHLGIIGQTARLEQVLHNLFALTGFQDAQVDRTAADEFVARVANKLGERVVDVDVTPIRQGINRHGDGAGLEYTGK